MVKTYIVVPPCTKGFEVYLLDALEQSCTFAWILESIMKNCPTVRICLCKLTQKFETMALWKRSKMEGKSSKVVCIQGCGKSCKFVQLLGSLYAQSLKTYIRRLLINHVILHHDTHDYCTKDGINM